ncbi:MAG: murein hydrolase activator EnvC [Alphaproteobacteria bacterium]
MRRSVARLAVGMIALLLVPLAGAQEVDGDLEAAERALRDRQSAIEQERQKSATLRAQAEAYRAELDGLRTKAMAMVAETREVERALSEIEARVAALAAEEAERRAALEAGRGPRANAITAMLRLSRRPPQALMLAPNSAVEATRSALLLAAVSHGLEAEAETLQISLRQIALLRDDLAKERQRQSEVREDLAARQAALDGLIAEKVALETQSEAGLSEAERRVAALVEESRDLEELIAKLEAARLEAEELARAAPPPAPPRPEAEVAAAAGDAEGAAEAEAPPPDDAAEIRITALDREAMRAAEAPRRGAFALPAEGRIVGEFGAETAHGVSAKGLSITARAGAAVIAPFAGKIVFAGPFRDYGQLLIIEHGEGYHSLLAGLGRIDTAVGRWVLAGEPVGAMSSSSDTPPQLYLELRHKGRPVNPLPWLATGSIKSSGS